MKRPLQPRDNKNKKYLFFKKGYKSDVKWVFSRKKGDNLKIFLSLFSWETFTECVCVIVLHLSLTTQFFLAFDSTVMLSIYFPPHFPLDEMSFVSRVAFLL